MRYVPLTASDMEWPMKRYVRTSSSVGIDSVRARAIASSTASRTANTSCPSTTSRGMSYDAPRL